MVRRHPVRIITTTNDIDTLDRILTDEEFQQRLDMPLRQLTDRLDAIEDYLNQQLGPAKPPRRPRRPRLS